MERGTLPRLPELALLYVLGTPCDRGAAVCCTAIKQLPPPPPGTPSSASVSRPSGWLARSSVRGGRRCQSHWF